MFNVFPFDIDSNIQAQRMEEITQWIQQKTNETRIKIDKLTKKIEEKLNLINQQNVDLEECYSKFIKQRMTECERSLNRILVKEEEKYIEAQLQRITFLTEQINEKKKICKNTMNEISSKRETLKKQIENYTQFTKTVENNFQMRCNNFQKEQIEQLKKQRVVNFLKAKQELHQEIQHKVKEENRKLEQKINNYEESIQKLKTEKDILSNKIQTMTESISNIQKQIIISIDQKPKKTFDISNFEIINVLPDFQKTKTTFNNLLILTPVHSLTRRLQSSPNHYFFSSSKPYNN